VADWRPLHLPRLIETIGGRKPLEENPAFVAWYKQDLADWAALYGVTLRYHPQYPLRPARALRAALKAAELGAAPSFALGVFRAYWSESRDISDLETLEEIGAACGLAAAAIGAAAMNGAYAEKLEANTREAIARGVFGVPSMICRDKLFFGNDRLDLLDRWLSGEGRLAR
jgi:2-hydroxychromene-2-carboxylate isomerase